MSRLVAELIVSIGCLIFATLAITINVIEVDHTIAASVVTAVIAYWFGRAAGSASS